VPSVRIPNVGDVAFPDEMPPEAIAAEADRFYQESLARPRPTPTAPPPAAPALRDVASQHLAAIRAEQDPGAQFRADVAQRFGRGVEMAQQGVRAVAAPMVPAPPDAGMGGRLVAGLKDLGIRALGGLGAIGGVSEAGFSPVSVGLGRAAETVAGPEAGQVVEEAASIFAPAPPVVKAAKMIPAVARALARRTAARAALASARRIELPPMPEALPPSVEAQRAVVGAGQE